MAAAALQRLPAGREVPQLWAPPPFPGERRPWAAAARQHSEGNEGGHRLPSAHLTQRTALLVSHTTAYRSSSSGGGNPPLPCPTPPLLAPGSAMPVAGLHAADRTEDRRVMGPVTEAWTSTKKRESFGLD